MCKGLYPTLSLGKPFDTEKRRPIKYFFLQRHEKNSMDLLKSGSLSNKFYIYEKKIFKRHPGVHLLKFIIIFPWFECPWGEDSFKSVIYMWVCVCVCKWTISIVAAGVFHCF